MRSSVLDVHLHESLDGPCLYIGGLLFRTWPSGIDINQLASEVRSYLEWIWELEEETWDEDELHL